MLGNGLRRVGVKIDGEWSDLDPRFLKIMLARDNVSSEVVDNANGLIAVRAYLTSLFFMDKAILPKDA